MSVNLKQQVADLHNLLAGSIEILKSKLQGEKVDVKEMLENVSRLVDALSKLERFAGNGSVVDCSRDMEIIHRYVGRMRKSAGKEDSKGGCT